MKNIKKVTKKVEIAKVELDEFGLPIDPETKKEEYKIGEQTHSEFIQMAVERLGVRCTLRDRHWRMNNLYKIKNKYGDIVTFRFNAVQEDYDKERSYRNCILKSRQHGFSTYKVIDALDKALFTPNSSNIIIAHTVPDAKKLFQKLEFAWNNLPEFLKDAVYLKSKTASGFEIGFDKIAGKQLSQQPGKVTSVVLVDTSGRSGTYTSAHITELSYLDSKEPEKAMEVMSGTIPAIPPTGECDIESTARGNHGEFYDLYTANKGKVPQNNKEFKTFFYSWRWDTLELEAITRKQIEFVTSGMAERWTEFEEYQKKYKLTNREITCYYYFWIACSRNWDRLRQEYPTTDIEAFQSSAEAVFSSTILDEYETGNCHERKDWRYYDMPNPSDKYVVGCDPSEGIEKDNHAIAVINISPLIPVVVATYQNNDISPTELAYEVLGACKMYNNALAAVERNNSGWATLGQLTQMYDHHRIYKEKKKEKSIEENTKRFGWLTGGHTKYKMVYDFKEIVEDFGIVLNDPDLINELRFYTKETVVEMGKVKTTLGAKRVNGAHYDLATAVFIAWQCREDAWLLQNSISSGAKRRQEQLELRRGHK